MPTPCLVPVPGGSASRTDDDEPELESEAEGPVAISVQLTGDLRPPTVNGTRQALAWGLHTPEMRIRCFRNPFLTLETGTSFRRLRPVSISDMSAAFGEDSAGSRDGVP
jgi:hypothetical protein